MQKLVFEDAWDRTISQRDREEIERNFREAVADVDTEITLTTIWIAVNHKNERLVTAIVHNKTGQNLVFKNTILQFWVGETLLDEHKFSLPDFKVPPETSMPWTFIFPANSFEIPKSAQNCLLTIKED